MDIVSHSQSCIVSQDSLIFCLSQIICHIVSHSQSAHAIYVNNTPKIRPGAMARLRRAMVFVA